MAQTDDGDISGCIAMFLLFVMAFVITFALTLHLSMQNGRIEALERKVDVPVEMPRPAAPP